jgi:UMP-CMP kinase
VWEWRENSGDIKGVGILKLDLVNGWFSSSQMIFALAVEHIIMSVLMQTGLEPSVVIFFDCPEEEMAKRVLNRNHVLMHYIVFLPLKLCHSNCWCILIVISLQGWVDDNIDTVKKRLKVFKNRNLPVINYYSKRGKLHTASIWKLKTTL